MRKQVSDFVAERLVAWGIKRIFGYSGDGINGVMGALDRAKEQMEFIQVPHEELGSFMAVSMQNPPEKLAYAWQLSVRLLFACLADYMTPIKTH